MCNLLYFKVVPLTNTIGIKKNFVIKISDRYGVCRLDWGGMYGTPCPTSGGTPRLKVLL